MKNNPLLKLTPTLSSMHIPIPHLSRKIATVFIGSLLACEAFIITTPIASALDPAVPESAPDEEEPVEIDAGLDANSFGLVTTNDEDDLILKSLFSIPTANSFGLVTTNDESGSAFVSSNSFAAAKGKCIFPKFTYYPGVTTIGRLRYGQADIRFEICAGKDPTDWKSSISVSHNGSASLQGYDFIKEQIYPTSDGDYYRFYEATFKWRDCAPYFAWPCNEKGTFKIKFYAWVVEGKPGVIYNSSSAPLYWTLYNTP